MKYRANNLGISNPAIMYTYNINNFNILNSAKYIYVMFILRVQDWFNIKKSIIEFTMLIKEKIKSTSIK